VIPALTFSIGAGGPGERLRDPVEQAKKCPSCGVELRRHVGEPWRVAPAEDA